MKLSEQVCTLEQSLRLQELGVNAESVFNHAIMGDVTRLIWGNSDQSGGKHSHWLKVPAYTVAELGEMLPDTHEIDSKYAQIISYRTAFTQRYSCTLEASRGSIVYADFEGPTEAQARAAMLIHLLESGIITPFANNTETDKTQIA